MGKQISHLIKNHFTSSYGEGCFEGVAGRADDTFFILGYFIDPFEFYVIEKMYDTFSKNG